MRFVELAAMLSAQAAPKLILPIALVRDNACRRLPTRFFLPASAGLERRGNFSAAFEDMSHVRSHDVLRELLTYMMEDPRNIVFCAHLLFCSKNLERIGDHITNVAESVHYLATGDRMRGDRPKGEDPSLLRPGPVLGERF